MADGDLLALLSDEDKTTKRVPKGDALDVVQQDENGEYFTASSRLTGSYPWVMNDSVSGGDPGTDGISFNNATPANITRMYQSKSSFEDNDVSIFLSGTRVNDGWYIQQQDSLDIVLSFGITAITDQGDYYEYEIDLIQSTGGIPANGKKLMVALNTAGRSSASTQAGQNSIGEGAVTTNTPSPLDYLFYYLDGSGDLRTSTFAEIVGVQGSYRLVDSSSSGDALIIKSGETIIIGTLTADLNLTLASGVTDFSVGDAVGNIGTYSVNLDLDGSTYALEMDTTNDYIQVYNESGVFAYYNFRIGTGAEIAGLSDKTSDLSSGGLGYVFTSWGAKLTVPGRYPQINGVSSGSEISSLSIQSSAQIPADGTIDVLTYYSATGDNTTVFKIIKNGAVAHTFTCDAAYGRETDIGVSVAVGDNIALEYDAGSAPGNGIYSMYIN